MYPQVTQFETKTREFRQQLQLDAEKRRAAAARRPAERGSKSRLRTLLTALSRA